MTSTNSGHPAQCPNCGNQVQANAQFCPFCGSALPPASETTGGPTAAEQRPVPVAAPSEATPNVPTSSSNIVPPSASTAAHRSQCEMIIGYLVPHRCDNPALGRCVQCGRGYCDEHMSVTPNGLLCLACQQGLAQPIAQPITAQTYDAADIATFQAASMWDNDDDTFSDLS